MKILIMANLDIGLYKFRKDLIEKSIEQGNQVFISLPYGELVEPLKEMGCHFIDTLVDRRGINPVTDGKLFLRYLKILKEVKPDLVVTYTIKPNIYGGLASRISRIPYAVNITGLGTAFQKEGFVKKLVCFLYKISCRKAKTVFFENEGNRQVFLNHSLVKEEVTCTLNGAGINLNDYPFTPYPKEQKDIRFLFIGRVMKEKGIDELFEAAKAVKERYPETVFDIVGPYEEDYKDIVEELVANKIINYHGYQEDVKPFIEKAHCFVLPSYHEGMANTLLEAGSMGRPLITSDIHGCMEAVEDGANGYLVETQNANDLEKKLVQFIELEYELKETFGKISRRIMEEKFEKSKVVGMTLERLQI